MLRASLQRRMHFAQSAFLLHACFCNQRLTKSVRSAMTPVPELKHAQSGSCIQARAGLRPPVVCRLAVIGLFAAAAALVCVLLDASSNPGGTESVVLLVPVLRVVRRPLEMLPNHCQLASRRHGQHPVVFRCSCDGHTSEVQPRGGFQPHKTASAPKSRLGKLHGSHSAKLAARYSWKFHCCTSN